MNAGMDRRTFITSSLAVVGASAMAQAAEETPAPDKRETYALYIYQFKDADSVKRADEYFQNALIPALRRAGSGPVGVLVEIVKGDAHSTGSTGSTGSPQGGAEAPVNYFVLVPLASFDAVAALPRTLDADAEYLKAGEPFLKASPKEPGYSNLEVRVMLAADFMPKLEVPEKKDTRVFELRRYRNPSEPAFRKKLEMFGKGGELALFRRVGLNPVFYGEMLAGPDMPNITYMLTFPEMAAKGAAWKAFGGDPEWHKLSTTPGYTDPEIIANIKSIMLKPTAYSQI
jgi:hypothetical protein